MNDSGEWAHLVDQARLRYPPFTRVGLRRRMRNLYLSLRGALSSFPESSFLRCIYHHWVYDDQVAEFRELLRRLQRVGRFITTEQVCRIADGTAPLDGRYFHVSLDDGLDNVYRNAFPVFRELGIPAAFFVPTALVGAADALVREHWHRESAHPMPTRMIDWDQAREMADAGIDIGSHTRNHVRLSKISGDTELLVSELEGSKHDIEQRLGMPCRYISWPIGTRDAIDERARAAVVTAGYEACFGAFRGAVIPGGTSLFDIPRHHFEVEWPWLHVRYFAAGGRET